MRNEDEPSELDKWFPPLPEEDEEAERLIEQETGGEPTI